MAEINYRMAALELKRQLEPMLKALEAGNPHQQEAIYPAVEVLQQEIRRLELIQVALCQANSLVLESAGIRLKE